MEKYSDLIHNGWIKLPSSFTNIVIAMMNMIENQMKIEYFNQCQQEFDSPFENSGAEPVETKRFTVRSYDWKVECIGDQLPNFDADKIKVFWYKNSNRGVDVLVKDESVTNLFPFMLNEYLSAVKAKYKKRR